MHWWSTTSSRHNTTYLRYVRLPRPFKASIHHYKPVTHKCQASPKMLFRTAEFQCSCSRLIRLAQQPHDSCRLHYTNRRHEYSSWKQEQFRHNSWAPTCESPIVAMTPCGLVGDTMASAPSPRCRNDTKKTWSSEDGRCWSGYGSIKSVQTGQGINIQTIQENFQLIQEFTFTSKMEHTIEAV
jgi:hypothetical protein